MKQRSSEGTEGDSVEDNLLLVSRPRRALLDRFTEGKVLKLETPWNFDKTEIISQMLPRDNGHPWAPALMKTKMETFENHPSDAVQSAFVPFKEHFRPLGSLRRVRPDPPEAPWGFLVPSSYSRFGKRAGIFNYRFIRI